MRKRLLFLFCCTIVGVFLLTGCAVQSSTDKIRDLEYTVVREDDIPEALRLQIEQRKAANFKITYEDGSYLYIACGYGEQLTGGYSIVMKQLYETKNAVYFQSELYGPEKGEAVCKSLSYPYIVIKLEKIDLPIVFS